MKKQNLTKLIGVLILASALTACSSNFVVPVAGNYSQGQGQINSFTPTKQQAELITQLENLGAAVSQNNDSVTILLPIRRVFAPNATAVRESAVSMLATATQLLTGYKKEQVTVVGFNRQSETLGKQQADVIKDYLWSHHADARFMFSKGVLINPASNEMARVEIQTTLMQ